MRHAFGQAFQPRGDFLLAGIALYEGLKPSWRLFAVSLGGAAFFWLLFAYGLGIRQPAGVLF